MVILILLPLKDKTYHISRSVICFLAYNCWTTYDSKGLDNRKPEVGHPGVIDNTCAPEFPWIFTVLSWIPQDPWEVLWNLEIFFFTAVLTRTLIYCDSKPWRGNPVGVAVCGNFKECPQILCHPPYQIWGFQVPSSWLRDGCVFLDPSCRAEVMLCSHIRPWQLPPGCEDHTFMGCCIFGSQPPFHEKPEVHGKAHLGVLVNPVD